MNDEKNLTEPVGRPQEPGADTASVAPVAAPTVAVPLQRPIMSDLDAMIPA